MLLTLRSGLVALLLAFPAGHASGFCAVTEVALPLLMVSLDLAILTLIGCTAVVFLAWTCLAVVVLTITIVIVVALECVT